MDYTNITSSVDLEGAAVAIVAIASLLAVVTAVNVGMRKLIDFINTPSEVPWD